MTRLLPVALFSTVAAAAAQSTPLPGLNSQVSETAVPPLLAAVKARLGESLTVADRAVTQQWMASLTELEKTRATDGDYEGAQRARQRREQASPTAGSADGRIPVSLTVASATNKGTGLTVNEGTAEFRTTGASMVWELSGDFKDWYEVLLTHAVLGTRDHTAGITPITGAIPPGWRKQRDEDYYAPTVGGWVTFQNMSSLGGTNVVLRREIVSTGGWNSYRTVSLGRIQLPQSNLGKFRLAGEEVASQGLMHFRQIELVPVAPPSQTTTNGEAKLKLAREVFDREFRKQITGSSNTYRTALAALENQAKAAKDNDLLIRVREELKLLTASPDLLALSSDEEIAAAPSVMTLTINNSFGCQFRGDTVQDNSKTFLTKLRPAGTASVTWRLPVFNVGSGAYEVAIKCRVPLNGGGTATLTAAGSGGVASGKPLKFEVKPVAPLSSGETPVAERRTEEPGIIVIGKNAETLTLSIDSLAHGDGWLMDLTSVTLTRTREVPPEKKSP